MLMEWIKQVLAWDEKNDPAAAPPHKPQERPWKKLKLSDRELLEVLSEGTWMAEGVLREQLDWGSFRFFVSTVRLVHMGWIEARATNGRIWASDYRLNPEIWVGK
jgi:hypothetical protein